MCGARRVLALLVCVVMLQLWVVKAFYLPGVAPRDFAEVCLVFFPTLLFFLASMRYVRLLLTEKEHKLWERPSPTSFLYVATSIANA